MYRAPSGARVFGAGTVQWALGPRRLEPGGQPVGPQHAPGDGQPVRRHGRAARDAARATSSAATATTDATRPTATSARRPRRAADGTRITLSGTASDAGGGVVAGVEVSTDNGATWHLATGTTRVELLVARARRAHGDHQGARDRRQRQHPGPGRRQPVAVSCPCSLWGNSVTPGTPDAGDTSPVEVGVKFRTDIFGAVTRHPLLQGRGQHRHPLGQPVDRRRPAPRAGDVQRRDGLRLAVGHVRRARHGPAEHDLRRLVLRAQRALRGDVRVLLPRARRPARTAAATADAPPVHAVRNSGTTVNGLYGYGSSSVFPTASYKASNYWVDVMFAPTPAPGQVTGVTATEGGSTSANVSWTAPATGGAPTSYKVTPVHRRHGADAEDRRPRPRRRRR